MLPDDLSSLKLFAVIASRQKGVIYHVRTNKRDLAAKVGRLSSNLSNEMCMQRIAYHYGISPNVLAAWKCAQGDKYVILMHLIDGMSLREMVGKDNKNLIRVFIQTLQRVFELNLLAEISHGRLNTEHVIVTSTNDARFVDYSKAKTYPYIAIDSLLKRTQSLKEPTRFSDYTTDDLTIIDACVTDVVSLLTDIVAVGENSKSPTTKRLIGNIRQNKLTSPLIVFALFRKAYQTRGRMPTPDDLFRLYSQLLSA